MVIVAHPDDADFGPAATAARWIDAGSVGWLVCCTSGDQGGEDPDLDPAVLSATREAEQRAAAEIVGYAGVSFLHQPDGALANDLPLRELLVREIRSFRPDAVLTQDPEVVVYPDGGINHTDHRAAGTGGDRCGLSGRAQPDGLPLARPGRARGAPRAAAVPVLDQRRRTAWVDVSATIDRKVAALRAHASQIQRSRWPGRQDRRVGGWPRGPDRGGSRRGLPPGGHRRRRGPRGPGRPAPEAQGWRRSGRIRSQSFQSSVSASARPPRTSIISPRVRPPAAPAR